jgi:hypothetical protein
MREAANFKVPTTGNNKDMRPGVGGGHPMTMHQAANSNKPSVKSNKVQTAVPVKYTGPVTMRRAAAIQHQENKKKGKEFTTFAVAQVIE